MKILNSIAIVLIVSTTLVTSAAANELKILVVVTENVEAIYDGNNVFATIENEVGDAIEEAAGTRPNVVLSHIRPQLGEPAIDGDALLQLSHLPPISTQRNAQSADLVLIVGLRTNDTNRCGAAPGMLDEPVDYLADLANGRFVYNRTARHMAYITMLQPGCTFLPPEVQAAHELGHVLFAEHEVVYDANGNAVSEVGSDGSVDKPFMENHGIEGDPNQPSPNRTIMYSAGPRLTSIFFSKQGAEFIPGEPAWGPYEDVAGVFENTTYDYVARHKEPDPPPPNCSIIVQQDCDAGVSITSVTPTLTGHVMAGIDMSYQVGSNPWQPIYTGAPSCPLFQPQSALGTLVSALVVTAAGAISECEVQVGLHFCPGGGGGPRRN